MRFDVGRFSIDIHKKRQFLGARGGNVWNSEELRAFFEFRYHDRKNQVIRLIKEYNLRNLRCLDVGSGLGQDSILLVEYGGNTVVSIEPFTKLFKQQERFIQEKNVNNSISVLNVSMENYNDDVVFDLVFMSSLGNWMEDRYFKVIPQYILDFIFRYVKTGGFFITRIYGGNFYGGTEGVRFFRDGFKGVLEMKLESIGFNVLEYDNKDLTPELLVVAKRSTHG